MRGLFSIMFLFGILGGAASQGRVDAESARDSISAGHRAYFQALSLGDSALFAELYAKDCWIMATGGAVLCGEDAPGEFFCTAYHRGGVRGGRFITVDVYGEGEEFVTEVGFYQFFDGGGRIVEGGTFLVLWRRMAGGWKRFRECFSGRRENPTGYNFRHFPYIDNSQYMRKHELSGIYKGRKRLLCSA
jgi:hypothetical protein